MIVESGLFDHMVMQRNRKNVCDQPVAGKCRSSGRLVMKVLKGGVRLGGSAKAIGGAVNGKFSGRITSLPVGGPYNVEIAIIDAAGKTLESAKISDVLVGDVWILAGQSNMEGIGYIRHALKPMPKVRAFYMEHRWGTAKDPLHELNLAVARVHAKIGCGPRAKHIGTGPGVSFGQEMFRRTGVPQGLIASAHGGTSMAQWDPALKKLGDLSLFGATLQRVNLNGGRVAGVVWYQGCSDANRQAAEIYTPNMKKLVSAFRKDLHDPNLPFVAVQISRLAGAGEIEQWHSIRHQQIELDSHIKRLAFVSAIDLPLDDGIHISGDGQNRLGVRLAKAMDRIVTGPKAGSAPIALKKVRLIRDKVTGTYDIHVDFSKVTGALVSVGRPAGFTLVRNDRDFGGIYRTELHGSIVVLKTCIMNLTELDGVWLYYGFGLNPYCNIVDKSDMALPAFGPVSIGTPRHFSPMVDHLEASKLLPPPGHIKQAKCPKWNEDLGWRKAPFLSNFFFSMHDEIAETVPAEKLLYFRCRFDCAEPMKISLLFGYDGPVKLFLDGKEVFCDPKGINPIVIDEANAVCKCGKGRHEVVFALMTNKGMAWGVCLRIHRLDVSDKQLEKDPNSVPMPVMVV